MTRVYKYSKTDRVTTDALNKYRKESGKTFQQIADEAGEDVTDLLRWKQHKRVPKAVLERLGLRARNVRAKETARPAGGSLFVCYVGKDKADAFNSVMDALKIEAKAVL